MHSVEEAVWRGRHRDWFLRWAEEAPPDPALAIPREWLEQREREHENLRAALAWSVARGEAEEGLRLGVALVPFWKARFDWTEGLHWLEALLALPNATEHPALRARALHGAGTLAWHQGDHPAARAFLDESLAIWPAQDDPLERANVLYLSGHVALNRQGNLGRARSLYQECLTIRCAAGDRQGTAGALYSLGCVALRLGDYRQVRARWQQSVAIQREFGHPWTVADILSRLGRSAYEHGEYEEACRFLEESVATLRAMGDEQGQVFPPDQREETASERSNGRAVRARMEEWLAIKRALREGYLSSPLRDVGQVAYEQGDYAAAHAFWEESLALFSAADSRAEAAQVRISPGCVARHRGDHRAAQALLQESLAICRDLENKPGTTEALHQLGLVAAEQGDLRTGRAFLEESLTRHRELGHRWSLALALNDLGALARRQGDLEAAQALLEESLTLQREMGRPYGIALSLIQLGQLAAARGDPGAAQGFLQESLALLARLGGTAGIAECLEGGAGLAAVHAQPERAARLLGAAEALRDRSGAPLPPADRADYERLVAGVRAALGKKTFTAGWAAGRALPLDQAIRMASG